MSADFARKLQLTAALLGCTTRKELCAAFRAVNPATDFELERAHKWLQGRAMPRGMAIYAEWAQVIGTARHLNRPGFVGNCNQVSASDR
jgi:hypothetical protein